MMPYCLILVLAPLSVFLNEENDIVPGWVGCTADNIIPV